MAPTNVAHTHTPLFIGFVPSLVCALVNHMLCCLCNKHTTCPILLNNHHTTTSHWCCNHTTCCPNTHNITTPPIIHQLAIVSPCPPPSHATACHTAVLQPHTCLAICSCPHTPPGLWHGFTTHNKTQPSTTGMCICGCVWCTVVGLHTHSFCVGFTTPQTPCAGSSMCHAHTNCTTTHTAWCGAPCHATTPHTWLWWLCVVQWWVCWLVGTTSIFACHALHVVCCTCFFTPQPCPFIHTHTLCHPHNNNHCTVWCHLGNNHQPTNHANQPHSWRVVCGVVCCT